MAQLTYDPTPSEQPEFNEAEQEAIQVGEEALAEQNRMLAGKFEDAEALEKAYIELQKKLGEPKDAEPLQATDEGNEEAPSEEEVTVFSKASQEWAESGKLTEETVAELSKLPSEELIQAYLEAQSQPAPTPDLSESDVNTIYKAVGGQENYSALTEWAMDALPEATVTAYNNVVNSGDPATIQLALAGLKAAYEDANGVDGPMLTGKPAANKEDTFRSQAEVVAAMSDPRYDRDPAYRNDVFAKLERSNLNTY